MSESSIALPISLSIYLSLEWWTLDTHTVQQKQTVAHCKVEASTMASEQNSTIPQGQLSFLLLFFFFFLTSNSIEEFGLELGNVLCASHASTSPFLHGQSDKQFLGERQQITLSHIIHVLYTPVLYSSCPGTITKQIHLINSSNLLLTSHQNKTISCSSSTIVYSKIKLFLRLRIHLNQSQPFSI